MWAKGNTGAVAKVRLTDGHKKECFDWHISNLQPIYSMELDNIIAFPLPPLLPAKEAPRGGGGETRWQEPLLSIFPLPSCEQQSVNSAFIKEASAQDRDVIVCGHRLTTLGWFGLVTAYPYIL